MTWLSHRRFCGQRQDSSVLRSFDGGGHATGSQGLHREDASPAKVWPPDEECSLLDHLAPEGCVSYFKF
jgi:hypothetical protein